MEHPMKPPTTGDLAEVEARARATVEANAKIDRILAKNVKSSAAPVKITGRMRHEAAVNARKDGKLD